MSFQRMQCCKLLLSCHIYTAKGKWTDKLCKCLWYCIAFHACWNPAWMKEGTYIPSSLPKWCHFTCLRKHSLNQCTNSLLEAGAGHLANEELGKDMGKSGEKKQWLWSPRESFVKIQSKNMKVRNSFITPVYSTCSLQLAIIGWDKKYCEKRDKGEAA